MANKWMIKLDVNLIEKETLIRLLKAEVVRLRDVLKLTSDVDERDDIAKQIVNLKRLGDQVVLAWIERDVELIPPPNRHSTHFPVYVGEGVRRS